MKKENVRQTNLLLLRHSIFRSDQDTFAKTIKVAPSKLSRLELGKLRRNKVQTRIIH